MASHQQVSYGLSLVRIWEKIYRIITALLCILEKKSLQYNDIYIVEFMLLCLLDFELTKRYPIARPYGRAMGYLL